jgi:hypothetical protein
MANKNMNLDKEALELFKLLRNNDIFKLENRMATMRTDGTPKEHVDELNVKLGRVYNYMAVRN